MKYAKNKKFDINMIVWPMTDIWDPKSVALLKRKSSGAFSQVYIGKKGSCKYAIKIFNDFYTNKTYDPLDTLDLPSCVPEENALLNMPEHPNIIKLKAKYVKNQAIHFVYELGKKSMHAYETDKPLEYIRQILRGLRHCHSYNIIHLDLKPDNIILMDDVHVKIADFGHSMVVPDVYKDYPVPFDKTTLWYRAPEQLFRVCYTGYSDIWSMGCIIYELYTEKYFCMTDNEMQMVLRLFKIYGTENIPHDYLTSDVAPKVLPKHPKQNWLGYDRELIPLEYRDILYKMLHPDYRKRPTIYEVCDVFEVDGPIDIKLVRSQSCPDSIDTTLVNKTPIITSIVEFISNNYGKECLVQVDRETPEDARYIDIITEFGGCDSVLLEPKQGAQPITLNPGVLESPYPCFLFLTHPQFVNPTDDFYCIGYKIDPDIFIQLNQYYYVEWINNL